MKLLIVPALLLAMIAGPAMAVERGCKAQVYIKKGDVTLKLDDFSARASAIHPNRARQRAAGYADAFMYHVWRTRNTHRKPLVWVEHIGVEGYDIDSILVAMQSAACSVSATSSGTIELRIKTTGDRGCGRDDLVARYDMTDSICDRRLIWESGIDRSGADYRNFSISEHNPGRCQAECRADSVCKAWTYVYAPSGGNPHCWLKNAVPPKRKSQCCTSGVKGLEKFTDRPGMDYMNFMLAKADPALCQAVCDNDNLCRSWTYVQPSGGQRAKCWLKQGVPLPRRDYCCTSGVKQ